MKKIIALLLALIMVFALVACGGEKKPDPTPSAAPSQGGTANTDPAPNASKAPELDEKNPVVIGHLADLTGNEASTGLLGQKAVDFAAKLINANGGIGGKKVVIETLDTRSDPSAAVSGIQTLVEDKGAIAIVGPTQIGHKQAVAPVAAQYEVPVMCYNGTPVFLTKQNEYFMSSGGGTAQMPTAMADYLYNELELRTIICISQQGVAGKNYVGPLIDNFKAMGGEVLAGGENGYIEVPGDATDIESYLMNLPEADALIGWLSGTQGQGLWKGWYNQLSDKMPLYGAVHGGFTDYFIWKALSGAAPEVVSKAMEYGVYAPINWAYSIEGDVNADFVAEWKNEFNETAVGSNLPGAGYTALLLIKDAYESIEGEVDGEKLYAALQNAEANGPEGHTAFNGEKVAAKAVYIAKVVKLDDGNFNYEVVKTYEDVPANGLTVG